MKRAVIFCLAGIICLVVAFTVNAILGDHLEKLTGLIAVGAAGGFILVANQRGWTTSRYDKIPTLFDQDEQPNKLEPR